MDDMLSPTPSSRPWRLSDTPVSVQTGRTRRRSFLTKLNPWFSHTEPARSIRNGSIAHVPYPIPLSKNTASRKSCGTAEKLAITRPALRLGRSHRLNRRAPQYIDSRSLVQPQNRRGQGFLHSGAERGRTANLLVANQALSQLSYGPEGPRSHPPSPPGPTR